MCDLDHVHFGGAADRFLLVVFIWIGNEQQVG